MITTLILGAGASCAYGYPTGSKLLEKVKEVLAKEDVGPDANLARNFDHLGIESLDAYMNLDPNAGPTLKRIIGEIIHSCENESALNITPSESPYAIFMQAVPPEKYEDFRIVTFNYDRSLECYLARGIMARNKCNPTKAFEALKKLKIVHVHGRLSNLPGETGYENPFTRDDLAYGYYNNMKAHLNRMTSVQKESWAMDNLERPIHHHAQQKLKNCYENNDVCEDAKKFVEESERVCFMGFGFHENNMKTLGYPFDETSARKRRVYGTTLEMPGNELRRVKRQHPEIKLITECTAADLLKHYVSLADPSLDDQT